MTTTQSNSVQRPAPVSATVLAYHRISERPLPAGTWVTPDQLASHLDRLLAVGCRPLAPFDLSATGCVEIPAAATSLSAEGLAAVPAFLITFDDGTEDLFRYRAVLAARGVTGVVFVPADLIGRCNRWEWPVPGRKTRHLTADQLGSLVQQGWEVGLHGRTHCDLTRLADAGLRAELTDGRRRLADDLGVPVRWLSYPYGRVDERVAAAALDAGLTAGFTLGTVVGNVPAPMARPRRPVYCIDTSADLVAKVSDPAGATLAGRWQLWKEGASHAVGRWSGGWKRQPAVGKRSCILL